MLCGASSLEDAAGFLDDLTRELVALVHCSCDVVCQGELGEEASNEGVSCSVCVNDGLWGDWGDRNHFNGDFLSLASRRNDGWLATLGDDHDTRAARASLLSPCDELGSADTISSLKTVGRGVGRAFVLVAENKVGVLDDLSDLVAVELDDEGGRKVEAKGLVIGGSELAERLDSLEV